MFTISHHKQLAQKQPSPLENEEEDTTLSIILRKLLLEFIKSMEEEG